MKMKSSLNRPGFTLVELLVVIGIIALLVSILLPSLNRARQSAASTVNLSNLRQIGVGLEFYRNEHQGRYPRHSSLPAETVNATPPTARVRWPDELYRYLEIEDVFTSPLLDDLARQSQARPWAHTCDPVTGQPTPETRYFGGYGYNYQYLGNARKPGGIAPFHAGAANIRQSSRTVAVADTKGSPNAQGVFNYVEAAYTIDPPLQSITYGSKGSRRVSADPNQPGNYGYPGGDGTLPVVRPLSRATPDARNAGGRVAVLFVDGSGRHMTPEELDDSDGDGNPDNGYWNGLSDPGLR